MPQYASVEDIAIAWDFKTDPEFQQKLDWVKQFVEQELIPLEVIKDDFTEQQWNTVQAPLKQQVKDQGLWACHLDHELGGQGMGQLPLAQMNLITGRCPFAQEIFGNMAPDSGNSELLAAGGTEAQKQKWLWPNLRGELRSAFAITEPWVACTDPTQIEATAVLDADEWVINDRKWMITNASRADFIIFMLVTEPDAAVHKRCSMIVVEKGTAGMDIFRDIPTMHHPHSEYGANGNHAEILLDNVRVPKDHLLGEPGSGFMLSQIRLGPGRIHHATRWPGEAERAFDMLCERTQSRASFGKGYAKHQMRNTSPTHALNWIPPGCSPCTQLGKWTRSATSGRAQKLPWSRSTTPGSCSASLTAPCKSMAHSAIAAICRWK